MAENASDNVWIPKESGDVQSVKLIWSTKNVNDYILAIDKGYKPAISSPFYEGKQHLRKGNLVFEYTDEEIKEIARCANDIVYFAEKYAVDAKIIGRVEPSEKKYLEIQFGADKHIFE